jgi:two-component system response regulator AdeR
LRNRKAVIINDDEESLGVLDEILSVNGYEPVIINDASSAVDITVQKEPDVIFLELKMPQKSGFELAGEINHVFGPGKVPIIAMSASFKDEFRILFDLCGINGYLRKPFNPLDVIWAIENIVERNNPSDK